MYHIAICDDDEAELVRIADMLDSYRMLNPECCFSVLCYTSMEALQFEMTNYNDFDMLLLDIYLPGKNGMEGAADLRNNGYDGTIIFFSTSKEHAIEAFEVSAFQYLLKPIEQTRFFEVLDKAFEMAGEDRRRYLALKADREVRRVALRNIVYCESQNQYQTLYLMPGEELRVRMTLAEIYNALCEFPDFVRVGSAYIVNLSYVDRLNAKEIKLSNGKCIWLPRGSYNALKRQYFDFYHCGGE